MSWEHEPRWRLAWTVLGSIVHRWEHRPQPVDTGHQSAAVAASSAVMERRALHGRRPHPWHERRADVIAHFRDNVRATVTPKGFTEAWRPDDHDVASTEMAWLIATQSRELPPEWLALRANGLNAQSLDALVRTDDDGSYAMRDLLPDDGRYVPIFEMVHAHELLGGMRRIEEFLRASDEQQWFTDRVRRYRTFVDGRRRVGFAPTNRSLPPRQVAADVEVMSAHVPKDVDAIAKAQAHRTANLVVARDHEGRRRESYRPGTFAPRADLDARALYLTLDEFDAERETLDTDHDEEDRLTYSPNTRCPNRACTEQGDECLVCAGSKTIPHTLGLDSRADWPQPGWPYNPLRRRREDARRVEAVKGMRSEARAASK